MRMTAVLRIGSVVGCRREFVNQDHVLDRFELCKTILNINNKRFDISQ